MNLQLKLINVISLKISKIHETQLLILNDQHKQLQLLQIQ